LNTSIEFFGLRLYRSLHVVNNWTASVSFGETWQHRQHVFYGGNNWTSYLSEKEDPGVVNSHQFKTSITYSPFPSQSHFESELDLFSHSSPETLVGNVFIIE
jgi:hypothetical protein